MCIRPGRSQKDYMTKPLPLYYNWCNTRGSCQASSRALERRLSTRRLRIPVAHTRLSRCLHAPANLQDSSIQSYVMCFSVLTRLAAASPNPIGSVCLMMES